MNDPLRRLSEAGLRPPPDVSEIRARAERIRRRRQAATGFAGAGIAAVALIALVVMTPGEDRSQLAGGPSATAPAAAEAYERSQALSDTAGDAATGTDGLESSEDAASLRAGEAQSSDGSRAAGGGSATAGGGRPIAETLRVELVVDQGPSRRDATFRVRVCNTAETDVEVTFDDGQRFDVVVSDGGNEVWRWSDGRAFAQVTGNERWGPQECRDGSDGEPWQAHWDGRDAEGRPRTGAFDAVGALSSTPEVASAPVKVCIVTC